MQITSWEASSVRKSKHFEARLAETKSLPDAVFTKMTSYRDRQSDEVDHLFSMNGALPIGVSRARRELISARTAIELLTGQVMTHERSAEEMGRCLNDVQYEVDGARAKDTQLTSRETRHQEQVVRIARRAGRNWQE